MKILTVTVLGAGNGGQAIAAYLALQGFSVRLWDRSPQRIVPLEIQGGITLKGLLSGFGRLQVITTDLQTALDNTDIIMVVTTADAHAELARACAPFLKDGQIIILNPGRTLGALVFRQELDKLAVKAQVYIAEAQSLVYACRIMGPAVVKVIGIKHTVPFAAMPAKDTSFVLNRARQLYPSFMGVSSVLETGLENIGAIFHPAITIFNAIRIEASDSFFFYQTMTPRVSLFLEQLDAERLTVGRAFGLELTPVKDWISRAYVGVEGDTLYARIRSNPAYDGILAPSTLDTRLLNEDVPTGLVPIAHLGKLASVDTPLCESLVHLCSALCQKDFWTEGRTLHRLGMADMNKQDFMHFITNGKLRS